MLGHKKSQKVETNWCLILNPLYNEIDKRKVARKISEAFGLSTEESEDLVNNTPIILLDNLTKTVGQQAKNYFRPTGANMLLTNEVYVKRKCYRTVWPEQPSLSFLAQIEATAESPTENSERLPADEALNEIRSIENSLDEDEKEGAEEIKAMVDEEELDQLTRQLEMARKERDDWREKFESQRRTVEKMSWEVALRDHGVSHSENAVKEHDRDREIERHKTLLKASEERFERLQEEYQQARNLFEEKLQATLREAHEWKERYQILEKEIKSVKTSQEESARRFEASLKDYSDIKKEKEALVQASQEMKVKYEALDREYRELKQQLDTKSAMTERETAEWQLRSKELNDQMKWMGKKPTTKEQGKKNFF